MTLLKSRDYLGGFFDGEGSISITSRKRKGRLSYTIFVSLSNTDRRPLEAIKSLYGGSICGTKKGCNLKVYSWTISNNLAYKFLKDIHPSLLVKQEQALIAVEFYEVVVGVAKGAGNYKDKSIYRNIISAQNALSEEYKLKLKESRLNHAELIRV